MSEAERKTTRKRKLQRRCYANSGRVGEAWCLTFCALGVAILKNRNLLPFLLVFATLGESALEIQWLLLPSMDKEPPP